MAEQQWIARRGGVRQRLAAQEEVGIYLSNTPPLLVQKRFGAGVLPMEDHTLFQKCLDMGPVMKAHVTRLAKT